MKNRCLYIRSMKTSKTISLHRRKIILISFLRSHCSVDVDEKPHKPKGVMLDWKDLYFPIGCGMAKGGVLLNAPVIRTPSGIFQQVVTRY